MLKPDTFFKEEVLGLTSQIKRAVISIPSNNAEGMGRQYKKDTLQFLRIARGSLCELDTQLQIAEMVGLIMKDVTARLTHQVDEILRPLIGRINHTEKACLK